MTEASTTPTPGSEEALAQQLYGPKPPTTEPPPAPVLPEADPAAPERVMFKPEVMYREDLKDGINTLRDLGATDQQLTEHTAAMAEAFTNAGLSSPVAKELHTVITSALKTPPSDEDVKSWGVEARRQVREKYGDQADARLARAREYVKSHPELARLMSYGPGSHPRIVMALVEQAHNLRIPRKKK